MLSTIPGLWAPVARGDVVVHAEGSWAGDQIEADPATAIRYLAPSLTRCLRPPATALFVVTGVVVALAPDGVIQLACQPP